MVDSKRLPRKPHPDMVPDPEQFVSFREWLKRLTEKGTGITGSAVAEVCGVNRQSVSNWKNAKKVNNPGPDKIKRLSDWTGADYDKLRRLVDAPKLRIVTAESFSQAAPPRVTDITVPTPFAHAWREMTDESKEQLVKIASVMPKKET